ncbi:DDE-type integrase/transposase/recombinase [Burkholderia latens]|uniref:DDE-type integrase/transposase/recombinase n=1 Tax=Burkholderia latens TaxID=488446 RepID=UPI001AE1B85F|nr:DDE-type integrase/transposase/recombinase [Burkholderia latens]QTO45983.1 DDE-type integrase/transposase/recombinase [Burkholderia latens]
MLNKAQLTDLFDHLGMPPAGRKLVQDARIHAPVRDVASRGGNVITYVASRKMAREIATESYGIEFAAAIGFEYDEHVLEFYSQPCKLPLTLVDDATGEIRAIHHTPDFLVIGQDGITLEEWKSEAKLTRLAEKYPYRYQRDDDGNWYSRQIEEQLAERGIRYRIRSDAAIPRRRIENLQHLADYYLPAAESCPTDVLARLNAALEEHGALHFYALLEPPYALSADQLNKAIADQLVVTDLDRESLRNPRRFRLYRDKTLREFLYAESHRATPPGYERFALHIAVGTRFEFEGQELTITLVGEKSVVCNRQDHTTMELQRDWLLAAHDENRIRILEAAPTADLGLSQYTEEEYAEALRRQTLLQSESATATVSARTLRRWNARKAIARANGDHEILALVPHISARGNHTARLSDEQFDLMDRVIDEEWRNSKAINYKTCHRHLVVVCSQENVPAPSYPTLIKHIKSQATNRDIRTREGKRIAYQKDAFVDVLHFHTPIHGSRPFQYVHIDHTELDIELISSRTGKNLGRPWLSLAVDAYSRRIVGMFLTYDPPSYHSVMMAVRDMVRRFHRLPEIVVVDNGSDFRSNAFKSFLKAMGCHLRFRPSGNPRHGAVLERMFGHLNVKYIHSLAGNTKATKHVRMVSGSHLPKNLAEWTLEPLYYGVEYWATEFYDQEPHPVLGESPREAFLRGLRESGSREHLHIQFNRDFLVATCPPVDREGIRQVHPQRGVKVNERLYHNPAFRSHEVAGRRLPVRYDPWDASSVYVRVKDQWMQAVCPSLSGLGQLTENERKALTQEYNRRFRASVNDEMDAQRLKEFMRTFTPEGALAVAFERQAENKSLYNSLQFASIAPFAPLHQQRLTEETSSAAESPAETRSISTTTNPFPSLPEAVAWDDIPDLDTF